MIVTTETGTKYRVDRDTKTWERVHYSDESGPLKTKLGTYLEIRLVVGDPMELLCPPLDPKAQARYISTSPVVSVEEE